MRIDRHVGITGFVGAACAARRPEIQFWLLLTANA